MLAISLHVTSNDMLKIKTNNGYLDLSSDFVIDITDTSPVMNDRGSQSVPVTVPCTPANCRALGFPHRIDMAQAPIGGEVRCIITDGVYNRTGTINICSASRREGITLNIGFDNSEAYSAWQEKTLKLLSNLPVIEGGSPEVLCSQLTDILNGRLSADVAVFQVLMKSESAEIEVEKTSTSQFTGETTTYTVKETRVYPLYLNETVINTDKSLSLVYAKRTVDMLIDNKPVATTLPCGYGVTPFIYLWKAVELVFNDLGYKIKENIFYTDEQLRRIVLLNNTIDSCCTGTLHYEDLMPSVTVEEFLNALYVRFGFVYFLSSETMTADLRFIRDIMKSKPVADFTDNITDDPLITYENARQLVLTADNSLTDAEPSSESATVFWRNRASKVSGVVREVFKRTETTGYDYELATGRIYGYDGENKKYQFLSSSLFNWNENTEGMDREELQSVDKCLPMVYPPNNYLSPQFDVGVNHVNTYIKLSNDDDVDDEDTDETPLALCFAFVNPDNAYTFGSVLPVNPYGYNVSMGGKVHRLSLLFVYLDGLYNNFWKEYDIMLRTAFRKVEVPARIGIADVMQSNILDLVSLKGQYLMWDSLQYSLPALNMVPTQMTLRTMKHSGVNAGVEVKDLHFSTGINYKWAWDGGQDVGSDAWCLREAQECYDATYANYTEKGWVILESYIRYKGRDGVVTPAEYVATIEKPTTQHETKTYVFDSSYEVYFSVRLYHGSGWRGTSGDYLRNHRVTLYSVEDTVPMSNQEQKDKFIVIADTSPDPSTGSGGFGGRR